MDPFRQINFIFVSFCLFYFVLLKFTPTEFSTRAHPVATLWVVKVCTMEKDGTNCLLHLINIVTILSNSNPIKVLKGIYYLSVSFPFPDKGVFVPFISFTLFLRRVPSRFCTCPTHSNFVGTIPT